ncbi:histidine kinase [Actinocrispum wychmicini]|uniref:histidine kinase n=1 Tax=Actinocrispum wychmicini TaxID=1213861 RepID=A0A4R2J589_9PSEU|nr:histidine kinase [Actinocrispum wychmicini]TCO53047.1 putative sensor protein [Actinocrispum wychmicini]
MIRAAKTAALSVLGLLVAVAHVVTFYLCLWGLVFLVPWTLRAGRWVATRRRLLAGIPLPYQPEPPPPEPDEDGLYRFYDRLYKKPKPPERYIWLLEDRATWRDLVFLALDPLGLLVFPLHARWARLLLRPPQRTTPVGFMARLDPWSHCVSAFGLSLLSPLMLVFSPFRPARVLADLRRRLVGQWTGVPVPRPYIGPVLRDRATWRDVAFLALDPLVGLVSVGVPALVMIYACWGLAFAVPLQMLTSENWGNGWYGEFAGSQVLGAIMAIVLAWLALLVAPACERANARWVRALLAPTKSAQLALRVQELTATRAAATDTLTSELHRIERDLHDGAQARLVAMGLGLGAVERLIDDDPTAAKAILAKVQDNSAKALVELRALVRGIHPPVLAERGLADAVRALALDTPMPVRVDIDLPHRLAAPIESAAYFAINAALTDKRHPTGSGTATQPPLSSGIATQPPASRLPAPAGSRATTQPSTTQPPGTQPSTGSKAATQPPNSRAATPPPDKGGTHSPESSGGSAAPRTFHPRERSTSTTSSLPSPSEANIRVRLRENTLEITISGTQKTAPDDPGLDKIVRRLSAFDGTVTVTAAGLRMTLSVR